MARIYAAQVDAGASQCGRAGICRCLQKQNSGRCGQASKGDMRRGSSPPRREALTSCRPVTIAPLGSIPDGQASIVRSSLDLLDRGCAGLVAFLVLRSERAAKWEWATSTLRHGTLKLYQVIRTACSPLMRTL